MDFGDMRAAMAGSDLTRLDARDALGDMNEEDGATQAPAARRSFPWFRGLILSVIVVAGLVDLARSPAREAFPEKPRAVPNTVLAAPAPSWKTVIRPTPLIGLENAP